MRLCTVRKQILEPRPSSRWPCPTECSCQFSQLYEAENTVTVLAKLAAHTMCAIVRGARQILKPRPSSRRSCPTECSCQFSHLFKAGNTVTVLAKLAAHALRAIARNARTQSRNQDPPVVSHAQLNIHAEFHSCIRQETRKRCSQSSLRMLCARFCAMRSLNPKTKTLQPSAMSQTTFMPIFFPIRQF